jgi:hypothetical protein
MCVYVWIDIFSRYRGLLVEVVPTGCIEQKRCASGFAVVHVSPVFYITFSPISVNIYTYIRNVWFGSRQLINE